MTTTEIPNQEKNITEIEPDGMVRANRFLLSLVGVVAAFGCVVWLVGSQTKNDRIIKLKPYLQVPNQTEVRALSTEIVNTSNVSVQAELYNPQDVDPKVFVRKLAKLNGLSWSADPAYYAATGHWRSTKNRFYYDITDLGGHQYSLLITTLKPIPWARTVTPVLKPAVSSAKRASLPRSAGKPSSIGSLGPAPPKMAHSAP